MAYMVKARVSRIVTLKIDECEDVDDLAWDAVEKAVSEDDPSMNWGDPEIDDVEVFAHISDFMEAEPD